ncbi:hypothetical protein D3C81_2053650 [compost metagenome]
MSCSMHRAVCAWACRYSMAWLAICLRNGASRAESWRGLRACSKELSKVASHCAPDTTSGGWRWFNETLMALTAFSTE